jgi:fluoride exporter
MILNSLFAGQSPMLASTLVATGGAVGALARYQLGRLVTFVLGKEAASAFPWATLIVNLTGCLAMGLLFGWFIRQGATNESIRLLLGVGILGGFTTFSTFSLEMLLLMERGALGYAAAYAAVSVLAGLGALLIGVAMMRGAA